MAVEDEFPFEWPPSAKLTPWLLGQLSGLCSSDCLDVLKARKLRDLPPPRPLANKFGQFSLF